MINDGEAGYQLRKGVIRIFSIPDNALRIEVDNVHTGTIESEICSIVGDHIIFFSRRIDCTTADGGEMQIFLMPDGNLTVVFGNKIYFRGVLV